MEFSGKYFQGSCADSTQTLHVDLQHSRNSFLCDLFILPQQMQWEQTYTLKSPNAMLWISNFFNTTRNWTQYGESSVYLHLRGLGRRCRCPRAIDPTVVVLTTSDRLAKLLLFEHLYAIRNLSRLIVLFMDFHKSRLYTSAPASWSNVLGERQKAIHHQIKKNKAAELKWNL